MNTPETDPPNGTGTAAEFDLRCAELGLRVVRLRSGVPIVPPSASAIDLCLRSGPVADLIARHAPRWASDRRPGPVEAEPGLWLLPVESGRITTLAVGLGPDASSAPSLLAGCAACGLDPARLALELGRGACFDAATADIVQRLLERMRIDMLRLEENRVTINGFTTQLTDSYETIDVLYSIGRGIGDLDRPLEFVRAVGQRLLTAMRFAWIAIRFLPASGSAKALTGRLLTSGLAPLDQPALSARTLELASALVTGQRFAILGAESGLSEHEGDQVLVQPLVIDNQVVAALFVGGKTGPDPRITSYDTQLLEAAAVYIESFVRSETLYTAQQTLFMGTLQALTATIDAKDTYTKGHSERVALVASMIARGVGLTAEQVERVRIAGLVHDVGKIGVPEAVLTKAGRLTDAEFALIKMHPEIGFRILKGITMLEDVLPAVLHHHERHDGRGYPHGLKGESIPLYARLMSIADTFDAMSSTRSYRPAMPRDRVRAEILRCAGTQFDPALVPAFMALDLGAYDEMVARHRVGAPEAEAA